MGVCIKKSVGEGHGPNVWCFGKGKPSPFAPAGDLRVSQSRLVFPAFNGTSPLGGKGATAEPFNAACRKGASLVARSLGYTEDFESQGNSH